MGGAGSGGAGEVGVWEAREETRDSVKVWGDDVKTGVTAVCLEWKALIGGGMNSN